MRGAVREQWRRASVSPALIGLTRWRVELAWRLRGRPVPPPHVVKQRAVLRYQRGGRFRTFIETGTFTGEMLAAVRPHFRELISIELSASIHETARRRFSGDPGITLLLGDSGVVLPRVLGSLDHPALFWLDGHYMGEGTGRAQIDTPVTQELAALLRHPIDGHLVLVDDARLFTGAGGYPTLDELRARIERERPGSTFVVDGDIIRCALGPRRTVS